MAPVIRDTGEIWSRLFDHRPFVHGEVRFFLREFQEKRNDREIEKLFKVLEYATDLKDNQLDRTEQLCDCHLSGLKSNIDAALSMCERVLETEEGFLTGRAFERIEKRESRRTDLNKRIDDLNESRESLDNDVEKKELEIRAHYSQQ